MLNEWKKMILDLEKRVTALEAGGGGEVVIENIAVSVKDEEDNPLSNANVVLSKGIIRYEGTTGSAGGCSLRNVKTGTYKLTATKNGYEDYSANITIDKSIESIELTLVEGETPHGSSATEIIGLDVKRALKYIKDCYKDNCIPTYQCLVVDADKTPLNKPVTATLNGTSQELTPNSKGVCELSLVDLEVGEYTVTVEFAGDEDYDASTITNTIKIFDKENEWDEGYKTFCKVYSVPEDFEKSVGDTDGLQIVACDPWGNPVTTTFLVNGVKYQIEGEEPLDVRPVTTFPLEDLPAGTYHFIIFNEEDINNANSNIEVVTGVLS